MNDDEEMRVKKELDHIDKLHEEQEKIAEESFHEFVREKIKNIDKKDIVVDLDGTLAYYDEWKGLDHIGDPLPGAQKFIEALKVKFNVIIFTTRTNTTVNHMEPDMQIPLATKVLDWLTKHNFPQVEVYAGIGKPIGEYYLDDRAVVCAPQKDPDVYWKILEALK